MMNKETYQHLDLIKEYLIPTKTEESFSPVEVKSLKMLRREDTAKPAIYVGAGTCGLGAGANKTIKSIHHWLKENKVDASVVQVGCIGLCSAEPIVDIQLQMAEQLARVRAWEANGELASIPKSLN